MKECVLNIGDVQIFDCPVTFTCYGLGSCVGLFLQDRTKGISGGAHIMLPDNDHGPSDSDKWYNVKNALEKMLEQFSQKGSLLETLRAKVTGGATLLNSMISVGEKNIQSVIQQLIKHNIYIAALEVGGNISRTAKFNSATGILMVRSQTIDYKEL